jgi:hypothetical protein
MNTRERLANIACQRDTYVPGFPRGRHISDGSKNSLKMLKAKRQLAVRFLDSICKGILHFKILFLEELAQILCTLCLQLQSLDG